MAKIAVIGYGNTLRGDDGIGQYVVSHMGALFNPDEIDMFKYQQLDIGILAELLSYEKIIFIDCSKEVRYGTIRCSVISLDANTPVPMTHHLMPQQIIALLDILYCHKPLAYLIEIGGKEFELGAQISEGVKDSILEVISIVKSFTQKKGIC